MSIIFVAIRNNSMDWEYSDDSVLGVFESEATAAQCCDIDMESIGANLDGHDEISYRIEPMMLNGSFKSPVIHYASLTEHEEVSSKISEMDELLSESYGDAYGPLFAGGGKASRYAPALH